MKKSLGFTLIEISVVISILSVLTTMGLASFVSYSRSQVLQNAAYDLTTTLNLAKSRASSQVKPDECLNQSLEGYKVVLSVASNSYELDAVCGGNTYKVKAVTLDDNISIVSGENSSNSFFFPVISGPVVGAGSITLSGFDKTRSIIVDSIGTVR